MIRNWCLAGTLFFWPVFLPAQNNPAGTGDRWESLAVSTQAETEDDSWQQDLERYRKDPVDINRAGPDELRPLRILTDLQISNLQTYREMAGLLVDKYELQAVPGWDIQTIKKILPYIKIQVAGPSIESLGRRFSNGEHSIMLRYAQVLERTEEYDRTGSGNGYAGSPQRLYFRYRYQYKNLLQYGLLGEKDAGEPFLKKGPAGGFDFYSFHWFLRKTGIIRQLALGDFTVNLGQGLILWQGLAFNKSAEVTGIKRQSAVLGPYNSAGEFYFSRGAGITVMTGKLESTLFASLRKLSAAIEWDSVLNKKRFSSFQTSGYHRTQNEIGDRNKLSQFSAGINLSIRSGRFQAGLNGVCYRFSEILQKNDDAYNRYAMGGRTWYNLGIDYHYTGKNFHVFGEAAADRRWKPAFLSGILLSVDPRADLSFLFRNISPAYQAVDGNAFTENSRPGNETGLYMGIQFRPLQGWQVSAYADLFRFPWLKFGVDAPSRGADFLAELQYQPGRQLEVYTRFRAENKQSNRPGRLREIVMESRKSWRTHINFSAGKELLFRARTELSWFGTAGTEPMKGTLMFLDIQFKPLKTRYFFGARLQYFETGGYDARIYAYENDVLYSSSVPAFYNTGYRYYLNFGYNLGPKLDIWLRGARITYLKEGSGGLQTGQNSIPANTEIKAQLRVIF